MDIIKELYLYIRFRKEINHNYGCALKEGYCHDETYNWQEKLRYWMECESAVNLYVALLKLGHITPKDYEPE